MKKLFSLFFLLILTINIYSQSTYSVGLAGIYGDDIDDIGINARAYINSKDHRFCFGPEFSFFSNTSQTSNNLQKESELFELNFNAHYIFEIAKGLGVYPLTGMNFSHEKEEIFEGGLLEEKETANEFGWNIGGGVHYQLYANWLVFIEYDYLISELSQNSISGGIIYTFGKGFKAGGHSVID